ncbi:MAG TPA: polymer-forming cytoskeletal protein [Methylophilaceae bacterium]|nr:polymer-forming cytoskeletal protein [Methylophilaceae bacterium]HZV62312.1 polymer-forming cytoskeletal protein [Methylophilaceae bacterium]
MLNKQGLFNRNEPGPARNTLGALGASKLTPTPGQLSTSDAATESDSKPESETKVDATSGSRLIVGPDVKLRGAEIQDCDTLVVEGRVEATMDSRVIQIAEHGAFSGKVGIDVAEVYGQFDGELTARSQLIIHSSGRVSGKIRYGKIFIEEGGEVSGDIASLAAEKSKAITSSLRSANGSKHD